MRKLSILMDKESFTKWEKEHSLGSEVKLNVAGIVIVGTITEHGTYKDMIEVRMRLRNE